MEPTTPQTQDSGIGAIAGSVIVVLVIIAGAFYLLDTIRTQKQVEQRAPTTTADRQTTSSTTTDLEAELESINVEDIDAELADIEASF